MQENFTNVNDHKIRYLEGGNSKGNLVLIHGLGASAERWEYVIPIFEENYKVIVPDLIGFGHSDKPLVDYTPEFFADFLDKFLQSVGIKKTNIVASSLGGQVTVEWASQNNSKIDKLVLVSPSGIMKHSTPALDAYVMAALFPNAEGSKNAFRMMAGPKKEVEEKIIEGFIERMQLPNAKMAFMSTLLGLKNADVITKQLNKISVPTLLIWGSIDPVIPIKYADEFVSAISNCKFSKMDGCGHTPYVDEPEIFTKIVLDFFK